MANQSFVTATQVIAEDRGYCRWAVHPSALGYALGVTLTSIHATVLISVATGVPTAPVRHQDQAGVRKPLWPHAAGQGSVRGCVPRGW
jgi:hypothetical protein